MELEGTGQGMVGFLSKLEGVHFVQLGANNGKTLDPIQPYVRKFHWQGVFVEPLEKPRRKLRKQYRGVPGLAFESSVITTYDGKAPFYEATKNDVVSSAKVSNWKLEEAIRQGDCLVHTFPCMTITSLLKKYDIKHLDLLVMDIEGSEYDVLRTLTLWPKVIHYEEKHLKGDKDSCRKLLESNGYTLHLHQSEDVTAWKPS